MEAVSRRSGGSTNRTGRASRAGRWLAAASTALVAIVTALTPGATSSAAPREATAAGVGGWELFPTPELQGQVDLVAVTAFGPHDAWAVGNVYDGITRESLILHWDGEAWARVPSPNRTDHTFLTGVAGSSPTDVWAVGYERTEALVYRTLTMHWDGSTWEIVDSPSPGSEGTLLNDVAAASPTDVWAVGTSIVEWPLLGETFVLHWDGETWTRVPSPNPSTIGVGSNLHSVDVSRHGDVWAAGSIDLGDLVQGTMVIRWDGSEWTEVPVPNDNPAGSLAGNISASPGHVWAVGWQGDPFEPLAWQRRGNGWVERPLPVDGGSLARATYHRGHMWVVGDRGTGALAARWDGRDWTLTPTVDPGTVANTLIDVAPIPHTGCLWAVGQYSSGDIGRGLIERFCP
jgi:hypothetical protein